MWQQLLALGVGIGVGLYLLLANRQQEEHQQAYHKNNKQPKPDPPQAKEFWCNLCNKIIDSVGGTIVCGHNFHFTCINDHQQQIGNNCPVGTCAEPFQAIYKF